LIAAGLTLAREAGCVQLAPFRKLFATPEPEEDIIPAGIYLGGSEARRFLSIQAQANRLLEK